MALRPSRIYSIACIVGARPNFIKVAPVIEQIRTYSNLSFRLIHTGQHCSPEMSDVFFQDLNMPEPDEYLGVAPGTQTEQMAEVMKRLERTFLTQRPDLVVVVGDVTSTIAAALVSTKLGIPVAHIEAGLRSFDRSMPEEINRILTDAIADYLFVTEESGVRNLRAEGVPDSKIFLVGNVMIDSLSAYREKALRSDVLDRFQVTPGQYVLTTLHRPSNVDDSQQLQASLEFLDRVAGHLPVVFPVHPRTRQRLRDAGLDSSRVILAPPLGYLDFLRLMSEARMVLTDSGGIQEETTWLNVPCLTLRQNTERPITVEAGTNRLVGTDLEVAYAAVLEVLRNPPPSLPAPEFWDGRAAARIVEILCLQLAGKQMAAEASMGRS